MQNLTIDLLDHNRPDLETLPITEWFDNSRLENWDKCNRYAWYSDTLNLDSSKTVMHAGTVIHHAIEKGCSEVELVKKWNEFKHLFTQDKPYYSVNKFLEVLEAYQRKYQSQPLNTIAREFPLASFHIYPEGFWLVGRCDEIIIHNGKFWALERKTTSGIRPDYIGDKNVSNQRLQYLYILSRVLSEKGLNPRDYLGGIMFDVIAWNGSKIDFARWPVMLPPQPVFDEWFRETQKRIHDYREAFADAQSKIKLPNKRRAQCHIYGKCAFLDLCNAWELVDSFDPPAILNNFRKKSWRPF